MRIDAHQHFWDIGRLDLSLDARRPFPFAPQFLPSDLKPHSRDPPLRRQRGGAGAPFARRSPLAAATWRAENAFIKGVVAWVDLTDPQVGKTLDELQRDPHFKGVRHLVHDEPDPRWLLRPDVLHGLGELEQRDIPYDLLLRPVHLPLVPVLAEKLPGLRMVIDHIAKPSIATGEFDHWARDDGGGVSDSERLLQAFRHDHRSRLAQLERVGPASLRSFRAAGLRSRTA